MTTTSDIILSPDQEVALETMQRWLSGGDNRRELAMGGLAGTGKTTLLSMLLRSDCVDAVLCPTGKAAHVLRRKGIRAETIHSAIYKFIGEDRTDESRRPRPMFERGEPRLKAGDTVAVDESSMVNLAMANDLRAIGVRILWVGDHGQLEPVGQDPGIMARPDIRLETVHRQALESTITQLAHGVRVGESFPATWSDDQVVVGHLRGLGNVVDVALEHDYDQIIVGYNKVRHIINRITRQRAGYTHVVEEGDRVICLQNNRGYGLFNGMQFTVESVHRIDDVTAVVDISDGDRVWERVELFVGSFADVAPSDCPEHLLQFDYAYAITCHKSQGSEWPAVMVLNCDCPHWDMNRWRYTAVTRAKERLMVAL